jgi:beta-mannosidase
VGELGAQAVPETAGFMESQRWPDLDWDRLERTHAMQLGLFRKHGLAPSDYASFDEWRQATQAYQAELLRHHVEHLRRLKYRPTGGFCQFSFADGHPAVTGSVLDHERVPKLGYEALSAACAPVIVTADRPAAAYAPETAVALDVHVVSDLRTPLEGARVGATLRWDGGSASWSWEGDVAADSCVRVGMVRTVVPDAPGPLVLELWFDADGAKAANRYESRIG